MLLLKQFICCLGTNFDSHIADDNLCQLMQKSKHAISIIILNYLSEISIENKKSTGYLNNKQSNSKQKVTQIEPQTVKILKRTVSPSWTEAMLNPSEILNLFQTWQLSMWKWSIIKVLKSMHLGFACKKTSKTFSIKLRLFPKQKKHHSNFLIW